MPKYILGVDGGGTKSHLVVYSENGDCAGTVTYGALNHEELEGSYEELEERLGEVIPRALKKAGAAPSDVKYAVLGLAGVDSESQRILVEDMVKKTGMKNILVCNDAILGVPAGCPEGIGICAINGSGFKVAAIDHSGATIEAGGLGNYTDDKGGGTWYGERACSLVYDSLYKMGRETSLREKLFELFGIADKSEFLHSITELLYVQSERIYREELSKMVFKAAVEGDAVALEILGESAEHYGAAIARLAIDMDFPSEKTLHVALAGTIFVKETTGTLRGLIKKKVAGFLGDREVAYAVLDSPPVVGAVMLAAQKAGFTLACDNLKSELKNAGL